MKIAVFYPGGPFASWNMCRGLATTLNRMGHEATAVPMPTERQASAQTVDMVKKSCPTIEALAKMDAIIVSGPEHIAPWLEQIYGKYDWKQLAVPKAAWLHESCRREDFQIDFEAIGYWADEWFFPAIQDAEFHDQEVFAKGRSHWLPLGVDTEVFQPDGAHLRLPGRRYDFDVAFIGLLYQKRVAYINGLMRHRIPMIKLGRVNVEDVRGFDDLGTAERLAENCRAIKVFLNLPALSQLLVSKVFEVLACGTLLFTPELTPDGGAARNMEPFQSGKHLMFYRPSHQGGLAQALTEWIAPEKDAERIAIAQAGCQLVREKHSLEMRLTEMLSKVGNRVALQ